MLDLARKYSPTSLKDIYGQEEFKGFFSSVLNRLDDSPRYFLVSGGYGCGKCVLGSTRVAAATGYLPIASLVNDPPEGFSPSTLSIFDGSLFQRSGQFYYAKSEKVKVLTLSDGSTINGTFEHPVLSYGSPEHLDVPYLTPIGDLTKGSIVFKKAASLPGFTSYAFSSYDWYVLGYTLCGGVLSRSLMKRGKDVFDSAILDKFADNFSGPSIPEYCFKLPVAYRSAFLAGLLTSLSGSQPKEFMYDLAALAESLGLSYRLFKLNTNYTISLADPLYGDFRVFTPYTVSSVVLNLIFQREVDTFPCLSSNFDFFSSSSPKGAKHFPDGVVTRQGIKRVLKKGINSHLLNFLSLVETRVVSEEVIEAPVYDVCMDTDAHIFYAQGTINHNTSGVRAFASDLFSGDLSPPRYYEIDSGDKNVWSNFEYFKSMVFHEVPGYKVVTVDECHLLPDSAQQMLLKIVEDFYGRLFIFFATTDPQKMIDPLRSRLHRFSLSLFTEEQCISYAKSVLDKEGLTASPEALRFAAITAAGHLRDVLKQCERLFFMGEDKYLEQFRSVFLHVERFFTDFTLSDNEAVEVLFQYHVDELRVLIQTFFRQQILRNGAPFHEAPFAPSSHPGLLAGWLRLSSLVKQPSDFYSMLYVFRGSIRKLKT